MAGDNFICVVAYATVFLTLSRVSPSSSEDLLELSDALSEKARRMSQSSTWTLPQHDGTTRVVSIDSGRDLDTLRRQKRLLVVLFTTPLMPKDSVSVRSWQINFNMLEMAALVLQNDDVTVAYIDMLSHSEIADREEVYQDGVVYVYKDGRRLSFYGHRSPEVLLQFLIKLSAQPVTVIDSKSQKRQFDQDEGPKVVGYFRDKNNKNYNAFLEAAKTFQPNIPFFVIFDSKMAKQYKLKSPGTVGMYKPYEQLPQVLVLEQHATSQVIVSFIKSHRRYILRKLTLQDVHSTWSHNPSSKLVLSFVNPESSSGRVFFPVLRRLARYYDHAEDYSFLWIDPEPFPSMLSYWQRTYEIDLTVPCFGLVNITDNRSSWFNLSRFHGMNDQEKFISLRHWLSDKYHSSSTDLQGSPKDLIKDSVNGTCGTNVKAGLDTRPGTGPRDEL